MLISFLGLSLEPTQQHGESSPHPGSLAGSEPGALAGFGERKVIPGIPGHLEEKDLELSSAKGLLLTLFFSCFLVKLILEAMGIAAFCHLWLDAVHTDSPGVWIQVKLLPVPSSDCTPHLSGIHSNM